MGGPGSGRKAGFQNYKAARNNLGTFSSGRKSNRLLAERARAGGSHGFSVGRFKINRGKVNKY